MSHQSMKYFLGCPVWSWPTWRGSIYPTRATKKDWLKHYSTRFNTVEGNTTFYGIPTPEVAQRWADETAQGFRFALKFPKSISHEKRLVNAEQETNLFLEVLSILHSGDRLGPTFLQLSPQFSPANFQQLEDYLRNLPRQFAYAVEVRHLDWFESKPEEHLNHLLEELEIDRVIFDSRPLYSQPPTTESETKSQNRKPRIPIRLQATSRHPMIRLIGRDDVDIVQPWVESWTDQVILWMENGLTPYVFTHAPDDQFAPQIARKFHDTMRRKRPDLPPLPAWENPAPSQLELF